MTRLRLGWVVLLAAPLWLGAGEVRIDWELAGRVIDGDTVRFPHGACRLLGIDAPERRQAGWLEATAALSARLGTERMRVMRFGHDRYGRDLCIVVDRDGEEINLWMVETGHAWAYLTNRRPYGGRAVREAETRARAARRGLWQHRHQLPPWEWRRRHR